MKHLHMIAHKHGLGVVRKASPKRAAPMPYHAPVHHHPAHAPAMRRPEKEPGKAAGKSAWLQAERKRWVENDEPLYRHWKQTGKSLDEFVRDHRAIIDEVRGVKAKARKAPAPPKRAAKTGMVAHPRDKNGKPYGPGMLKIWSKRTGTPLSRIRKA